MRSFFQLCIVTSIFVFSSLSIAAERAEMIQFFIELEKVEDRADEIIEGLKDELIRSDRKITDSNFDATFGEIFEDYREAYISANENAYGVYDDAKIKELYDFYKSPFGEWYRQEEKAFGPRINEYMKEPNEVFRAGLASKRKKGKKRKR